MSDRHNPLREIAAIDHEINHSQPPALRLADELQQLADAKHPYYHGAHGQLVGAETYRGVAYGWRFSELLSAADELRRLYQSEREGWRYADELERERKRLTAEVEALRGQLDQVIDWSNKASTEPGQEGSCY